MNNAIKVGFLLEADMPVSTMVYHKYVVCTLHKHTLDLMFSLPAIQEHLLPIILEYDMKIPVTVFSDQNTQEWVKESDVMRHHQEFYGPGSREFACLLDDIEDTKIKLIGLIQPPKTHPFPKVRDEIRVKYANLRELAAMNKIPSFEDLSSWLYRCRKSVLIHSEYLRPISIFGDGLNDTKMASRFLDYMNSCTDESKLFIFDDKLFYVDSSGDYCRKMFSQIYEFVYIFDFGDKIKIGKSANPYRRLSDFSEAFFGSIKSFFLCEKSKIIETKAHFKFKDMIISGEYFKTSCLNDAMSFLEENSVLSFDSRGNVYKDRSTNKSKVRRFSDLSDFIKK